MNRRKAMAMGRTTVCAMILLAGSSRGEMMNACIRFEGTDAVSVNERSICLATEVVQEGGDWLVLDPGEFTCFQPAGSDGRVFVAEGGVSKCALTQMKELGWSFSLAKGGTYDVWMRAKFPLAAGYNHRERMDEGETHVVIDSVDGARADKSLVQVSDFLFDKWLQADAWHWFVNRSYDLKPGRHFFHWPANGAWLGGCVLDRMVLVRKGSSVNPQKADVDNRQVRRALSGSVVSRRIKTDRVATWTFDASFAPGDGKVSFEYSYGGKTWSTLVPGTAYATPDGGGYLYVRICLTAGKDGLPPLVYAYGLRVEKRK